MALAHGFRVGRGRRDDRLRNRSMSSLNNCVDIDADGIVRYTPDCEAFDPFNEKAMRQMIQRALPTAVQQVNWTTAKGLFR